MGKIRREVQGKVKKKKGWVCKYSGPVDIVNLLYAQGDEVVFTIVHCPAFQIATAI